MEWVFSCVEGAGCGLISTQIAEEEAHLWSDQQWGFQEAGVDAKFRTCVLLTAVLYRGRKASCVYKH